jgi:hypothetical protein
LDKSQYFSRWVVYSKQGDKVSLVDLHNPEAEPLTYDPWLGLVVSLADGPVYLEGNIMPPGCDYKLTVFKKWENFKYLRNKILKERI